MPITDDDVRKLVDALERDRQDWIDGRFEPVGNGLVQADDMTIFGPFGGDLGRNGPELMARQRRASAQFAGGTGRCELLKAVPSGDVVVLVMLEHNVVRFAGSDAPQRWVLRTTQVFRRDGDRWLRLHRHADPLIHPRPLPETLALLDG